jgi:hypothetical protein
LATKFEAHPFLSAVLQDDIAFWIWVLVAGQLVSGVAVAVFTIVYISFGGHEEESFTGFGSKIAVVELDEGRSSTC